MIQFKVYFTLFSINVFEIKIVAGYYYAVLAIDVIVIYFKQAYLRHYLSLITIISLLMAISFCYYFYAFYYFFYL